MPLFVYMRWRGGRKRVGDRWMGGWMGGRKEGEVWRVAFTMMAEIMYCARCWMLGIYFCDDYLPAGEGTRGALM